MRNKTQKSLIKIHLPITVAAKVITVRTANLVLVKRKEKMKKGDTKYR